MRNVYFSCIIWFWQVSSDGGTTRFDVLHFFLCNSIRDMHMWVVLSLFDLIDLREK